MSAGNKSRTVYIGWYVVAASFILFMFSFGTGVSFGVYLKPLAADFGWSRGGTAFAYSAYMACAGLSAALSGRLVDRFGVRPVLLVGTLGIGLGQMLAGRIHSQWQLYLAFGLVAGGLGSGFCNAPLLTNAGAWFERRRGLATGITMAGSGMGVLFIPPLARFLINLVGWRGAFPVMGSLALLIMLPMLLVVREPRGGEREPPASSRRAAWRLHLGVQTGPGTMWYLRFAALACCLCHSMPLVHVVAFATDKGISPLRAASVISAIGLVSITGRIGMGVVADRVTGRVGLVLCGLIQSLLMILLIRASTLSDFFLFSALWSVGYGGIMIMYPIIVRELYGGDRAGSRLGSVFAFATVGMASGGYLGGFLYDVLGAYPVVFMASMAFGLLNVVFAGTLLLTTSKRGVRGSPLGEMA